MFQQGHRMQDFPQREHFKAIKLHYDMPTMLAIYCTLFGESTHAMTLVLSIDLMRLAEWTSTGGGQLLIFHLLLKLEKQS
jgi:hypothetical protein